MTAQTGDRKEKHFIIATAGHVDHGKSALVKALTGTDPDRLPEEQRRQITIDLGFAELDLGTENGERIHAGVIDVPGHEDFVRNMIAGVGSIDLALFVVAADDGWMPQTEEHLQILTYLGVEHAVVALTKSDLANAATTEQQIRDQLRETAFAPSPIVPTSTRTRQGLENLKRALARELATMQPQRDVGKPRLPIDRAFTIRGMGTVVTGTLTGGQFHRGQNVIVQPQRLPVRIRSIETHGRELEIAQPGMRTALNLPDISIDDIKRGDVVTVPVVDAANSTVLAILERSSRLNRENPTARPLKQGASVYLHHGTTRVVAKVAFADAKSLFPGERKIAQLKLQSPLFTFLGDCFVLRDPSERYTIAGGTVLNPNGGEPRNFRQLAKTSWILRAAKPYVVDVCIRAQMETCDFVEATTLLSRSHFSATEVASGVTRLTEEGALISRNGIVASAKKWRELCDRAAAFIDDAHRKNPERRGVELIDLRGAFRSESAVFESLVEDLCKSGFVRVGAAIARKSHRASLPPQFRPVAEKIRTLLGANSLNPPSRKELARDQESQAALRFLIEQAEITELDGDVVLLSNVLAKMRETVVAFISKHGPATASELRQELGTSRRIVIPFLESLDRAGVTRRAGDKRALGRMM
ncbi:MAG TPA: selenocysteine-specific translation elongation factor [Candidatus Udaeobacter sp.]|jgi:selenocysteine-specific elongation factor|nr:selenocysteine-specific translation elongation factor [Candidatus Udaeobacter sp.]